MTNKSISNNRPTTEQTDQHDMLYPILRSLFDELKEFSKKKQDGVLNVIKVKMTNRILLKVKSILQNDPTIEFLDLLDEEKLPTNSDAVLIIDNSRQQWSNSKLNIFITGKVGKLHLRE